MITLVMAFALLAMSLQGHADQCLYFQYSRVVANHFIYSSMKLA